MAPMYEEERERSHTAVKIVFETFGSFFSDYSVVNKGKPTLHPLHVGPILHDRIILWDDVLGECLAKINQHTVLCFCDLDGPKHREMFYLIIKLAEKEIKNIPKKYGGNDSIQICENDHFNCEIN